MRQSDILDILKRKHPDLTEEIIELILKSFHDGLRYYWSHPEECRGGILIAGLMTTYVSPTKIENYIKRLECDDKQMFNNYHIKKGPHDSKEDVLKYYHNLLKTLKQNEPKARKKSDGQRFIG